MLIRFALFIFLAAVFSAASFSICAQNADGRGSIIPKANDAGDDDDKPKSFKETLVKLRIEKEKKEFDEMLGRGEEALKLSEELEKAYEQNGRLNNNEITKLATVEKLVKKIRSELGGDDDESDDKPAAVQASVAQRDLIKSFRSTTVKLFEELKKTTRFTVSAAAIQTSNAVLRLAKFLRISR
ncbi:MAG: hypothetical protein ABL999_12165 [Pyrinomonadaceae bacterium]